MKTIIYKRKKIQIVMKEKIIIRFNFITNILILLLLIFGAISYADSNGIFIQAKDVVPGTFGEDEGSGDFTFPSNLTINSNLIVKGKIIYEDEELTKKYNNMYVNENQLDSISSDMIINGTIEVEDTNSFDSRYVNSDGDTIKGNLSIENVEAKSFKYIN